jgi:SH3 domain protein
MVFCLLVLGSSVIGSAQTDIASAQTDKRYVVDMIILTLREGPGNEHKVIRTLRSDAPVHVLEEGEAFLKVRTEDGQEGWVAKQYITTDTPKPIVIAGLNKEIEKLKARIASLEGVGTSAQSKFEARQKKQSLRFKELEKNLLTWKEEALSTKKKLEKIMQEHDLLLEASSNVTELVGERDSLKETNGNLEATNKDLQAQIAQLLLDHDRLIRNEILHWFLAGSGVFFVGLIIGKLSRKKKRF